MLRLQRALPAERWAPFLRNHDQTRTLTALGGDIARARLAAMILLTLPGLPFVYYGEELGMTGNKPDERLRTPMHWRRERGRWFLYRCRVAAAATRFPHGERRSSGRRPRLAAQPVPAPDSPARGESRARCR